MKTYTRCRVVSHPRAGSHWLYHLLRHNLVTRHAMAVDIEYGNHPFGSAWELERDVLTVYIHRGQAATIDSIWRMRHRFGLDEYDREAFTDRWLCEMWSPDVRHRCAIVSADGAETVSEGGPDTLLRDDARTLPEYLRDHVNSWTRFVSNVNAFGPAPLAVVAYEDLRNDLDGTLAPIARQLGSDLSTFEDVRSVGWRPL